MRRKSSYKPPARKPGRTPERAPAAATSEAVGGKAASPQQAKEARKVMEPEQEAPKVSLDYWMCDSAHKHATEKHAQACNASTQAGGPPLWPEMVVDELPEDVQQSDPMDGLDTGEIDE